ncbi:MAG: Glu-tRNA(Gln) amidotransferase subunit GatE [Asgard group archaeon]|nr:Glu-tRNA(Gln) amidotransferase subunit GatE [Asgard group archaeon]
MLNPEDINYEELGFKAGLEIHHQIKSQRKLFCNCKPNLCNGEPDYRFERYFRPVLGEMGDFDEGMLIEYEKGYRVIYHAYEDTVCVYEQDEQPPFWPDYESIYAGFELAHWLNFTAFVDEVVVSRKQYLDGSITTGFQRTMIVARDGYVPVNGKKIRISNLTVEEDAARKVKTENYGRTVYYNLDRLGIPLVEVITDHRDCTNPQDLLLLGEYIGLTLRISGIGKRGIGVVRQDVNISIDGGKRVEIKGVQDISMFPLIAEREVQRQDMLLKIAEILKKRKFKKESIEHTYIDITDLFPQKEIPQEYIIMGIRIPKFERILGLEIQPGKDFGQDIIEKAELISGIPKSNMFHSNEVSKNALRKRNFDKNEKHFFFEHVSKKVDKKIRKSLGVSSKDGYFLGLGPQKRVIHAMKKIVERAKMALDGVPLETRRLLPNGNTEFLRVIHGKDRLYPDTDTPPLTIDIERVQKLQKKVEKRPWEIEKEHEKKYGFNYQQVKKLIRHNRIDFFEELVEKHNFHSGKVYHFLEGILISLAREGYNTSNLSKEWIIKLLNEAKKGTFAFNQIPELAKLICENPDKKMKQLLSDLKIKKVLKKDLARYFEDSLQEYHSLIKKYRKKKYSQKRLADKLTGYIMRQINHSMPGKSVHQYIVNKLKKAL